MLTDLSTDLHSISQNIDNVWADLKHNAPLLQSLYQRVGEAGVDITTLNSDEQQAVKQCMHFAMLSLMHNDRIQSLNAAPYN